MEAKNDSQDGHKARMRNRFYRFLFLLLALFGLLSVLLSVLGVAPFGVNEFWRGIFLGSGNVPGQVSHAELGAPQRLIIERIGLIASIQNPATQDDLVLERALKAGPVHYPGSGLLGSNQNILLFGHSSGLPIVHNQAFKVFNGLKTLTPGDAIKLEGANTGFVYAVDSVSKILAENQRVDIGKFEGKLILSTCNVWGAKEERFVVTSHLVKSYPLKK